MFFRPILIFVVVVFSMSTLRTVVLAAKHAETDFGTQFVLGKNGQGVLKKRPTTPISSGFSELVKKTHHRTHQKLNQNRHKMARLLPHMCAPLTGIKV